MTQVTMESPVRPRRSRRLLFASPIERLIGWAEPTIRGVCREVDRDLRPQGVDLADLYQEGRIAVFEAADEITSAQDPQAFVATVVRRRVRNALRTLAWPPLRQGNGLRDRGCRGSHGEAHAGR